MFLCTPTAPQTCTPHTTIPQCLLEERCSNMSVLVLKIYLTGGGALMFCFIKQIFLPLDYNGERQIFQVQ